VIKVTPEMLTAICSICGTAVGTFGGIVASNRLTAYRIDQLEKKVDKHNTLIERMVIVEQSTKSAHHRLDDLVHELGMNETRERIDKNE
jgi:hypothetical protein